MKNVLSLTIFALVILFFLSAQSQAQNKVIVVPLGGATGNAEVGDVLSGETFSNAMEKGLQVHGPRYRLPKPG